MNPQAQDSAQRAAQWLLRLLDPATGSLRGASDLRAYYKTPAALLLNGYEHEARQVLRFIQTNYAPARPDAHPGDLNGAGVPWFSIYRTYPHAWICFGAHLLGEQAFCASLADFIATMHHAGSGGFSAGEASDIEEIMTTSMAGIALLHAGRTDLALAAGNWLCSLWNQQPDPVNIGLFTTCRDGRLITSGYADADAAGYLVDVRKARQWYFQYGISAALLVSLARQTGDRTWLDLAHQFLRASAHAGADRYQTPQSGKVGWGAAWAFELAGDAADSELAAAVARGLCALQNGDGSWLATGVYGGETAAADSVTIDVTAEFATLQAYIGKA